MGDVRGFEAITVGLRPSSGFKAGTSNQNLAAENAALKPIFLHTHHSLASIFTAIVTVS